MVRALVAAISVAGVVLVGQAVAWVRFDAAGLPADQIMALLDRTELIAIGTLSLAYFVVGGILAVAAAYGLDDEAKVDNDNTPNGLIVIVAVSTAVGIWAGRVETWAAIASMAGLAVGTLVFVFAGPLQGSSRPALRWLAGPTLVVASLILVAILGGDRSGFPLLFFGAAAVLGVLSFGVAKRTGDAFRWYGVAVFLSTVLFGAVVGIAKTLDAPKVQPLAAIVESSDGTDRITGIFVGESNGRLYYGRVRTLETGNPGSDTGGYEVINNSGALLSIACDRLIAYGVGTLQLVPNAIRDGTATVADELARQPEPPLAEPTAESGVPDDPSGCKVD